MPRLAKVLGKGKCLTKGLEEGDSGRGGALSRLHFRMEENIPLAARGVALPSKCSQHLVFIQGILEEPTQPQIYPRISTQVFVVTASEFKFSSVQPSVLCSLTQVAAKSPPQ